MAELWQILFFLYKYCIFLILNLFIRGFSFLSCATRGFMIAWISEYGRGFFLKNRPFCIAVQSVRIIPNCPCPSAECFLPHAGVPYPAGPCCPVFYSAVCTDGFKAFCPCLSCAGSPCASCHVFSCFRRQLSSVSGNTWR